MTDMAELDLRKHIQDGISFKRIFLDIIIISVGLYLSLYWKDRTSEILDIVIPHAQGITGRIIVGAVITVLLVVFVYVISYIIYFTEKKFTNKPHNNIKEGGD